MFGIDVRVARATWTVFLVLLLVWMAYLARQPLFVLVLAIFLAYLVYPAVNVLQRYAPRLPRAAAVLVVFLVLIVVITLASVSIGQQIGEQATALSEKLPALLKDPHLPERIPLPDWLEPLRARIVQTLREQFDGGNDQTASLVRRIGVGAVKFAGNLLYLVIIPILAFLLVKDAARMRDGALDLLAAPSQRATWETIVDDVNMLLGRYVRALLLLSVAAFCAYSVAFSLMGVPYAFLLAAVAGPLEFIPVLGPLAGGVIAVLVAAFSGYEHLLWIVVFLLAYRVFQDYVLNPYLMSEGIELHPVVVIVAILAGEEMAGVPGMFLAIPVLAAVKLFIEKVRPAPHASKAVRSTK